MGFKIITTNKNN